MGAGFLGPCGRPPCSPHQASPTAPTAAHKGQYISKKRASRFVIPSRSSWAGSPAELWISVGREILRCAQDDNPQSAWFDWQNVFFKRSFGSLAGERSFAALRMTILNRLGLTGKTSSLSGALDLWPARDPKLRSG